MVFKQGSATVIEDLDPLLVFMVPGIQVRLVLRTLSREIFFSLIQVDGLVLRVNNELLIQDDKTIALEPLVPQSPRQLCSLHLCKVIFNLFSTKDICLFAI